MIFTERQRDFLKAASKIVSNEGLSKLTIRNVAKEVGVTEPAVYRHFTNKNEMLKAMLNDMQSSIYPHLVDFGKGTGDNAENFKMFINNLFREFKISSAYALFIFSEEIFHNEPELKEVINEILLKNIEALTDSFKTIQKNRGCRTDIDPDKLAFQTLASIRLSVSRWHMGNGSVSLEELAEKSVSTLIILFDIRR